MKALRTAVGLLTRVPVHPPAPGDDLLARSHPWYPLVGAAVGAVVGLVTYGAALVVGEIPAAILGVAGGVALTGALHHDGLADVFDGFVGGGSREQRMEIMKDPRLGTYGAAALFLAFALQAAWLAALATSPFVVAAAAGAGAASRAVIVVVMRRCPPAAAGLGASQAAATTRAGTVVTAVLGAVGGAVLGPGGVAGLAAVVVAAASITAWARRAIGGITGDVLGAVQVVSELAFLGMVVGMPNSW